MPLITSLIIGILFLIVLGLGLFASVTFLYALGDYDPENAGDPNDIRFPPHYEDSAKDKGH